MTLTAEKDKSEDDDYNYRENYLLLQAAASHVNVMRAQGPIMLKL
jgi:hypothetical protein